MNEFHGSGLPFLISFGLSLDWKKHPLIFAAPYRGAQIDWNAGADVQSQRAVSELALNLCGPSFKAPIL